MNTIKLSEFTGCIIDDLEDDYYVEKWYKNGKLHRENGPAFKLIAASHRHEAYYKNGKRHRLNGPAIQLINNSHNNYENYYIDGVCVLKENYEQAVAQYLIKNEPQTSINHKTKNTWSAPNLGAAIKTIHDELNIASMSWVSKPLYGFSKLDQYNVFSEEAVEKLNDELANGFCTLPEEVAVKTLHPTNSISMGTSVPHKTCEMCETCTNEKLPEKNTWSNPNGLKLDQYAVKYSIPYLCEPIYSRFIDEIQELQNTIYLNTVNTVQVDSFYLSNDVPKQLKPGWIIINMEENPPSIPHIKEETTLPNEGAHCQKCNCYNEYVSDNNYICYSCKNH